MSIGLTKGQQQEVLKIMSEPNGSKILELIMTDAKKGLFMEQIIILEGEMNEYLHNTSIDKKEQTKEIQSIMKKIHKLNVYDSLGKILNNRLSKGLSMLPTQMKDKEEVESKKIKMKRATRSRPSVRDEETKIVEEILDITPYKRKKILTTQITDPFNNEEANDKLVSQEPIHDEEHFQLLDLEEEPEKGGKRMPTKRRTKKRTYKRRRSHKRNRKSRRRHF